jgi:hypothetical protein
MAIEPLGKWFSFANDQFSMTISQFSEIALFQRSLVKSEVVFARTLRTGNRRPECGVRPRRHQGNEMSGVGPG